MKKPPKSAILVTVLSLLLLAALVGYRSLSGKAAAQPDALSASSQTAPDFTVQDVNGSSVALSSLKGKPVVLNFWASWCPPCKAEMPDYEKMYREYGPKGVAFFMVNMTDGSRETVATAKQFLQQSQYTFPVYFDTKGSAAQAYNVSAIPDSVFIGRSGTVAAAYEGMIDAAAMRNNIEAILKS